MMLLKYKNLLSANKILLIIVLIGGFFRFWGLGSAEIFHDEGFYAFRSIGYLDYIQNDDQTQPIQWFKDGQLPYWTKFSFHDHPPLFFLAQNISFKVFGDSLFAARLPSALAGIFSIIILYLLIKKFFKSKNAGLLAALLLSVNHIHIWISRSSLHESILILLILLSTYFFIRFLEDRRWWKFLGLAMGLSFLTKYTSFFLLPLFLIYLLIFRRDIFRDWRIYAALFVSVLIFSPVIIYNFHLFKTVGHFDLQFAYLFRQSTPEWRVSFGKNQELFSNIVLNLLAMYSISSLVVALFGMIYSVFLWIKKRESFLILWWFIAVLIVLTTVATGSAFRFISLYAIFLVFFQTLFLIYLGEILKKKFLFKFLLAAFLAYEVFFTIEGIFMTYPDFGVAKLDRYFDSVFGNKRSLIPPKSPNPHLDRIIKENLIKYAPGEEVMIIYDENTGLSPKLWLFARRLYYHGIPSVTVANFKNLLRSFGPDYFKGYKIYFVKASSYTFLNSYFSTNDAFEFENFLKSELNLTPKEIIYGYRQLPMFYVYQFSI